MSKQNLKSQAKRKRELAKLGKRQAKDEKRALRKAERSEPVATGVPAARPAVVGAAPPPKVALVGARPAAAPPPAPLTLAAAVQRWKTSKVVKPKVR